MQISDKFRLRFLGENNFKSHLLKKLHDDLSTFLKNGRRITFKVNMKPKVSVIIPTFNGAHHTLRCLLSLVSDRKTSFEVLIFDNGSTDETDELLKLCDNVKVIKSPQNLGYIKANNAAAEQANGEFLLLLNNDARIVEGSIQDSINVFSTENCVGAVGVRIKLATGKLQEAGCMIFRDGTSNGYLRYSEVDDPRAMFMRDVDYCSGIYLLLRRQQFVDLGGFDEIFAPAYYEETDLCMKLRARGLRVIYCPIVVVEHFEFGSQASKKGRNAILERRPIFINRWKHDLETQGFSASEYATNTDVSSRRLVPRPRILFLAHELQLENISEISRAMILEAIELGCQIMIFGVSKTNFSWTKFCAMFGLKVEIIFAGKHSSVGKLLKSRSGYFDLITNLGKHNLDMSEYDEKLRQGTSIYKFSNIEEFTYELQKLKLQI
jgi:O-antigen biosynthesis protein